MTNVLFVSTEGQYKHGVEKNLDELLALIKSDFNSNVDDWWDNSDLNEEMELLEDFGNYDENLNYFIEVEGVLHDMFDYLTDRL